jgi:anthranilate synthase component 1
MKRDFLFSRKLNDQGGAMFVKTRSKLEKSSRSPNLIPITRELPADLETPVSVYLKLAGSEPSFLLESVTGGEQVARYSFIGVGLNQACILHENTAKFHGPNGIREITFADETDPLSLLRDELARYRPLEMNGLPPFLGGWIGYLGYEMVRFFEPNLQLSPHSSIPDAILLLADTLVAFDHAYGRLMLIANAFVDGDKEEARAKAEARLDQLEEQITVPLPKQLPSHDFSKPTELRSNKTKDQFCSMVETAKEHIAAGDIFQVVLSQRFSRQTNAHPFAIYRTLRRLNPSPYMFFFDFKDLAGDPPLRIIGASPEMHVRLQEHNATIRPLAGTRHRGHHPAEDLQLEKDLLADPKERAEHVMLVDLARNDLGRVCSYGSVQVPEQMKVERYSHVMHIVSQVEGLLQPEFDAFELMKATFPAGTVSGAPKFRAMQIISDLETDPRGPYAGAVGYFSYDGSLDSCITIRTMVMKGQEVSVQAGAGIVADSVPEREYQECINKARALTVAVENAEKEVYV